jgi:hypothetical protein
MATLRHPLSVSRCRRLSAVLGSLLLVGGVATFAGSRSVAAAAPCSGATCTVTFSYTGAAQTFTVPTGVTSITVDARAAAGGESAAPHQSGGLGARGSLYC